MRARLIYNPTSGREEMKKRLSEVLQRLEHGGIETSTHATMSENHHSHILLCDLANNIRSFGKSVRQKFHTSNNQDETL